MVRDNGELKGKINWFSKGQLIEAGIISADNELSNLSEDQFQDLKNRCVEFLVKKGFVFFDYIGYRTVIGRTGKLKEFGVQFHHIK
jgi:hypothetical protein